MAELTQSYLRKILKYDPETGIFTWYIRKNGRRPPTYNVVAGTSDADAYIIIYIDGVPYLAARLAWLYMTGKWPDGEIDHIEKPVSNNAWANLREATHQQNCHNLIKAINNTSGFKGVSWHKQTRRWRAKCVYNGQSYWLGLFDTPEEAHAAYCRAAKKLHGAFARAG